MRSRLVRPIVLLAVLSVPALSLADPQQFYSAWNKHPKANYWFTSYNYKPTPDADDYQHHYVIWTPASPKYCYCYNPSTKSYYGRWDLGACGKESCHLGKNPHGYYAIAKGQQKGTLAEIPETAFTPRSAAPQIPVDAGNPAQPAAPAGGGTAPPAAGGAAPPTPQPGTPAPPAATTPPATPAPATPAPATPAPGTPAPVTPDGGAAPEGGTAPAATTPAPAAQANTNPQIQPPPDLPEEAFPDINGNS